MYFLNTEHINIYQQNMMSLKLTPRNNIYERSINLLRDRKIPFMQGQGALDSSKASP